MIPSGDKSGLVWIGDRKDGGDMEEVSPERAWR